MDVEAPGEQTTLSLQTHGYSKKQLRDYPRLLHYLLEVKRACAWANSQLGIISPADGEAIDEAALVLRKHPKLFNADVMQGGGGVAVHMNINEALCQQLGNSAWISKINASQSTTDVCTTALNITLADELAKSKAVVFSLAEALQYLAESSMHVQTRGRTCLRDAGLLSYGERFFGFSALFRRHHKALDALADFAYSNLGATALGTGEGIESSLRSAYRSYAAERLGQLTGKTLRIHPHFIDSVQNRDDLFTVAITVESLAVSLLKLAKDIRLLASGPQAGFNEIRLPSIIKGSSFYQNKINPTLEETVIQMSFTVLGLMTSAKLGIEHSELDMNIYYMHSSICLLDALQLINNLIPKYIQYSVTQLTINGQ